MDNPTVTNKRSIDEEDGSCLAMSPLTKRQKTGQPLAKNKKATTLKKGTGKKPQCPCSAQVNF
jgi:hypothetical protein